MMFACITKSGKDFIYIQWVVIDFLLVALSLPKQQVHNHIGISFNGTGNYIENMKQI